MNLLSFPFFIFLLILTILYFLVPKRFQWWVLLAGSLYFYGCSGPRNLIFIGITALSTYLAARRIESLQLAQKAELAARKKELDRAGKAALKERYTRRTRRLLILTLVLNFGLLSYFKYLHFVVAQINHLITAFGGAAIQDTWQLIVPMGISFYTFQTMGYLVDVYWKKVPAEKHFGKMLLFVCFFPQVTQGPISDWSELTGELFTEHDFTYHNFSWGLQRMFWGYFKKMALANALGVFVRHLFAHYSEYTGIAALIGAFLYSIQIYADFSGYMDIVCGFCEVLGIRLTENFERPYFSKSIAEYWRRWHSSLGRWFKTYIYYPIAMAKWNQKLGRYMRDHFGKAFGRALPASVALVAVWLTTGLWHGASWGYIAWGGVNGLFIIFSLWMEPIYEGWKQKLHINESAFWWRLFQVVRTFVLVTLIKVLPEVGGLRKGLGLWKQIFTNHTIPTNMHMLVPLYNRSYIDTVVIILATVLLLCCSLIQRRQPARAWMQKHIPYPLRLVFFAMLIILAVYIGGAYTGLTGGFMYAEF